MGLLIDDSHYKPFAIENETGQIDRKPDRSQIRYKPLITVKPKLPVHSTLGIRGSKFKICYPYRGLVA